MKKIVLAILVLMILAAGLWVSMAIAERAAEQMLAQQNSIQAAAVPETTEAPQTVPETTAQPETNPAAEAEEETQAPEETVPLLTFTEEEEQLLLKLGMAERGDTGCVTCMTLVMRTVLNRVESAKFSSSIRGVIYAQDQFTPAMDGSLEKAEPNDRCYKALDMIRKGWDESQGALYYEWCEGESWHSQNLNLLFTHCDTRFYN